MGAIVLRMHCAEELIVHVGLAKTGTSAIQETFFAHKADLCSSGILYPGNEPNHYHFQSMFADDPHKLIQVARWRLCDEAIERARISALRDEFEREVEATRPRLILLSSEYFPAMSVAELRRMAEYLRGFAASLRVVAYVRDPWGMTVSTAQEEIRVGLWSGPIRLGYRGDMLPLLQRLEQGFGVRLEVRLYEGNVVRDFTQWVGAPLVRDQRVSNPALGYESACLLAFLNAFYPQFADGVLKGDGARDWMVEAVTLAFPHQQPIRLSKRTALEIQNAAESDLKTIEDRYFSGQAVFRRFYEQGNFTETDDLIDLSRLAPAVVAEGMMRALRFLAERGVYYYEQELAAQAAAKAEAARALGQVWGR